MNDTIGPMPQIDQTQLAEQLVAQADAEGANLVGPDGMLAGLTKNVLETALEAEMSEHLGYDKHEPMGRNRENSRNGTRTKTVQTEVGPVQIEVPRDRDGSFEPGIVKKRQRRLDGIDDLVLSLTARGLTTGEVAAHFEEVYGAKVSKDTISRITDKVIEDMTEWQHRLQPGRRVHHGSFLRQLRRQACNHRLMNEAGQRDRASGEPIRVAVVDDEELFRRGLTMLLALEDDIEVVGEAGDGIAATELAESTAPDVILMDVRMPKGTGVEACVAIKEVAPTTLTIMLTASDEEADLYEAVKSGASGYLLKNSSIDEVAQAIRLVADGQSLISPLMAIKLLDEFKQMSRADRDRVPTPRVTARELEVLKLVAQGLHNREIGTRLFISENTVKNHVRNILEKLQLHSRMDAVMYAMRENLFDVPDG